MKQKQNSFFRVLRLLLLLLLVAIQICSTTSFVGPRSNNNHNNINHQTNKKHNINNNHYHPAPNQIHPSGTSSSLGRRVDVNNNNNNHKNSQIQYINGNSNAQNNLDYTPYTNNLDYYKQEVKDFRNEASGLFGNIRIPAAVFAGASAGAAFAMPLMEMTAEEGLKLGLVKRLYALLMMTSLSSQVVAIVVSTLTVGSLATKPSPVTRTVADLIRKQYELEWVSARLHFLSGVIMFILGIGLRAWVSIAYPVIAKAALGVIVSTTLLCVAFIQDLERAEFFSEGTVMLPIRYFRLLMERSRQDSLFALALTTSAFTWCYIVGNIPHIIKFLIDKSM